MISFNLINSSQCIPACITMVVSGSLAASYNWESRLLKLLLDCRRITVFLTARDRIRYLCPLTSHSEDVSWDFYFWILIWGEQFRSRSFVRSQGRSCHERLERFAHRGGGGILGCIWVFRQEVQHALELPRKSSCRSVQGERKRIAFDLHETVCQEHTGAILHSDGRLTLC